MAEEEHLEVVRKILMECPPGLGQKILLSREAGQQHVDDTEGRFCCRLTELLKLELSRYFEDHIKVEPG